MKTEKNGTEITIYLEGRIDSTTAPLTEREILDILAVNQGNDVIFDAGGLDYISSAGLRVLMKVRKDFGKKLRIVNVSRDVYDILETTGFTELFNVQRAYRQINVEGLPVIGQGFLGTIYRLDPETIVKVYKGKDALSMIENEKRVAKKAFLAGIPTAISYDVVRAGENYGSVFELLNAKTFNEIMKCEDMPFEDIIRRYVELLKLVHSTRMENGAFPSCRDKYLNYLEAIRPHLTNEQYEGLKRLLVNTRDKNTVVHGDIHMKNVMLSGDEVMLIDMDTLGLGDPVFEFAGIYVTYVEFGEDEPNNSQQFLQIPREKADKVWQMTTENYFSFQSDEERKRITDRIRLAAAIRFMSILENSDLKYGELGEKRIAHTKEHIDELLKAVDTLEVAKE